MKYKYNTFLLFTPCLRQLLILSYFNSLPYISNRPPSLLILSFTLYLIPSPDYLFNKPLTHYEIPLPATWGPLELVASHFQFRRCQKKK